MHSDTRRQGLAQRRIDVNLAFGLDAEGKILMARPLGTLSEDGSRLVFEYHSDLLARPLPVSPLRTPVQPGEIVHDSAPFDGLPGLLADSLPNCWGRAVQDRALP